MARMRSLASSFWRASPTGSGIISSRRSRRKSPRSQKQRQSRKRLHPVTKQNSRPDGFRSGSFACRTYRRLGLLRPPPELLSEPLLSFPDDPLPPELLPELEGGGLSRRGGSDWRCGGGV